MSTIHVCSLSGSCGRMSDRKLRNLPDQDQREIIFRELDKTLLVESAAGTGKTTSMIGRMIALLSENKCQIDSIAAVTFTRKTAAELRSRFQIELEKALHNAHGVTGEYLLQALNRVENCFIGTIHSFCARLLRERPVEAGIDIAFKEIDDTLDLLLRQEAWDDYVSGLFSKNDPVLDELIELGLEIGKLADMFLEYTTYPDVEEWPVPEITQNDFLYKIKRCDAVKKLIDYIRHVESLLPHLPPDYGTDKLIPKYQHLQRMVRQADIDTISELMEIVEEFKEVKIVKKYWHDSELAEAEQNRWNTFKQEIAEPLLKNWRELRYKTILRIMNPAREKYDINRRESGLLNFQDLLMKSAALLKDKPSIRNYFRKRFTHILVDEFQDTDPIQAEVMLLLTADDIYETDWRKCRPVPGSLFVVGDPKQSIYRFRRADIVTYNQVKEIIEKNDGLIVTLSTNFRTIESILKWVNSVFNEHFPEIATDYSPHYVPLQIGRMENDQGNLTGVNVLYAQGESKDEILEYESNFIARFIRNAIDKHMTVPRTQKELESGIHREVTPGDFLIISRNTKHLSRYAQKLQEYGIPHQVTGGSAMNEVRELALLYKCLRAVVEPDNSLALAAVLRSELFGISDTALYNFKTAGGQFDYHVSIPDDLEENDTTVILDAFEKFKKYAFWISIYPPIVTFEKIADDLGLLAHASTASGGDVQAGSIFKALELLRSEQAIIPTASELIERLGELVQAGEKYDGLSARSEEIPSVRIMNLHKVKGLEAPVVFLADPTGESKHNIKFHIDRSGQKVHGYLAFYEYFDSGGSALLAHPADWESFTEREEKFLNAESKRLLYVAATRAGTQLIISQREKYNNYNPWNIFKPCLSNFPSLQDPGPQIMPEMNTYLITHNQINKSLTDIKNRWNKLYLPTYNKISAKEISITHKGRTIASGERGAEWGSVIHTLLENALTNPELDLRTMAASILKDYDFPSSPIDMVEQTVRNVMNSEVLKRALSSERRLMEVPFQTLSPLENSLKTNLPTILKGIIDLVFLEKGSWVIVDYKTDTFAADAIGRMIQHYIPQVRTYARAWEECTGQSVCEIGLFFTHLNQYHSEQFPSVS